jgi:uncharacterized protein (TIGR02284 family)
MEIQEWAAARGQTNSDLMNQSEINQVIELLNQLIASNRSLVQIYETAVPRLHIEDNDELLQRYAAQHHSYVAELSNLVVSFGGTPETHPNAILKRIWVNLKAALSAGDGPIISELAQAAEDILTQYGRAMNESMPDTAYDRIRHQMSEIRITVDKLSALDTVYNS